MPNKKMNDYMGLNEIKYQWFEVRILDDVIYVKAKTGEEANKNFKAGFGNEYRKNQVPQISLIKDGILLAILGRNGKGIQNILNEFDLERIMNGVFRRKNA